VDLFPRTLSSCNSIEPGNNDSTGLYLTIAFTFGNLFQETAILLCSDSTPGLEPSFSLSDVIILSYKNIQNMVKVALVQVYTQKCREKTASNS